MDFLTDEIAKHRVAKVLKESVAARDNDSVCYEKVIESYGASKNMRFTTLERRVRDGKLPSRDTVTRLRRKIQETNEDLRGLLWEKRHVRAEEIANMM